MKINTNKRECEAAYQTSYKGNSATHTFCGIITNPNKGPKCSIYGNSVFVEFMGRSFLGGMTVLKLPKSNNGQDCSDKNLHFFTDLYDHLPWILNNIK